MRGAPGLANIGDQGTGVVFFEPGTLVFLRWGGNDHISASHQIVSMLRIDTGVDQLLGQNVVEAPAIDNAS
jgi:hypothetical protein